MIYILPKTATCLKQLFFVIAIIVFNPLLAFNQTKIDSFSPLTGPVNTTVVINGSGFNSVPANNIVFFGAVKATVTNANSTSITVTVPFGTTYQPITVTTNGFTAYSSVPFKVTFDGGGALTSTSFDTHKVVSASLHPNCIALGDFDGDGKTDMATANNYSTNGSLASISVLKNTGTIKNISFANKQVISTGVLTYAIAAGDLDGDGKLDLVSSSIKDQSISVFKNTSTPGIISFASKIDYPAGDNATSIGIADFDGDGKPDIAVTNMFSNTVSVYRNTSIVGAISFAPRQNIATGLTPNCLAISDLDGDNKPDIVVTNSLAKSISILKNVSNGGVVSFEDKFDISTGNDNTYSVVSGDLDGDGKPDLVITKNNVNSTINATVSFSILRNITSSGVISFSSIKDYPGDNTYHTGIGDLNGDGKADLAILKTGNDVSIYENKSSPGNIVLGSSERFYATSPYFPGIADFDGDGIPDLAVANFTFETISIFRNRVNEPGIFSFSPLDAAKGDTITIRGVHFSGVSAVKIGGVPTAAFMVVDDNTIQAVVGAAVSDEISITGPKGTGTIGGFKIIIQPVINSFTPAAGGKGLAITIRGSALNFVDSVSFGGIPASSFTIVDATTIIAKVGEGATGDVSVRSKGGMATRPGFSYVPAPVVTSFTPTSGIEGTKVTIYGENFTAVSSVKFGNISAKLYQVLSPTSMYAIVGKGASGDVTVTSIYGPGSLDGFTHLYPSITSFTPTAANKETKVIITGTNFINVSSVTFGGIEAASFTQLTPTTIEAIPGLGASGDISVTTMYETATLSGFTHNGPPVADSFNPSSGGPGTVVHIAGNNFTHTNNVSIGGIQVDSFTVVSSTEVKAFVGAGATGPVKVTTNFGSVETGNFRFIPLPKITDFSPLSGPVGTVVTIHGTNFSPQPQNNIVFFGSVQATISAATTSSLTVIVPAGSNYEPITLMTNNLTTTSSKPFAVTFDGGGKEFNHAMLGELIHLPGSGNDKGFCAKDLDGDGRPELISLGNRTNRFVIMQNQSTAEGITFNQPYYIPTGYSSGSFGVADFDGDGKPDLANANEGSNAVAVMKNASTPGILSFEPLISLPTGPKSNPTSMAVADLDGDGRIDIIATGNRIRILKNTSSNGAISFADQWEMNTPFPVDFVTTGDLDGDGKEDLISIEYGQTVVYRNLSMPGKFSFSAPIPLGYSEKMSDKFVSITDLDGDNKNELVLLKTRQLVIFKNNSIPGQIQLEELTSFDLAQSVFAYGLNIGDLDGDTRPEMVINIHSPDKTLVFRNTSKSGVISFDKEMILSSLENPKTTAICDLDGDGKPELCITLDIRDGLVVWRNQVGESMPCPGSPIMFTASLTGDTYEWVVFGQNGWSPLADDENYSGTKTMQLKLKNIPYSWNNRVYNCRVNGMLTDKKILVLTNIIDIKSKVTTPGKVCIGTQLNVQFSVLEGDDTNGIVELWESKNDSIFHLIDSSALNGTSLNFQVTGGNRTSTNAYFFKFKPSNICANTTNSDTSFVEITKVDTPLISVNSLYLSVANFDSAATYLWQRSGDGISWSYLSSDTSYLVVSSGTYRVNSTIGNCSAFSAGQHVTLPVIPPPVTPADSSVIIANLYPNPTKGEFVIDSLKLSHHWEVVDILDSEGKLKLSIKIVNKTSVSVDVSMLPNGLYMAVLRSRNGKTFVVRFIKG